jgi:diaminopimelate epimerase
MEFRKAHGTGNDFVVLPDPDGALQVTEAFVRALCDRRFGVGADGMLRVVRTAAAGEQVMDSAGCLFFMDYRNADGSLAQMCGNGARVFAQYLWETGLAEPGPVRFATRGGARVAQQHADGSITVAMGPATIGPPGTVTVGVGERSWPATQVHVPNPHAVVMVTDLAEAGALTAAPTVTPASAYPDGANVEFLVVRGPDHIAMRVHERGVGETLSCGTGACAAAVAWLAQTGDPFAADRTVRVDVPGGTVAVGVAAAGTVALRGPSVTVAEGRLAEAWLEAAG